MQPETPQEEFLKKHYIKQGPLKDGKSFPPIFYILFPKSKNGIAKISRRRNFGLPDDSFFISYMREDSSTPEEELKYYEFEDSTYIKKASPIKYDWETGKVKVFLNNIKHEKVQNPDHPEWPMTTKYTDVPPTVIESNVWYRGKNDSAISKIGSPFGLGTSALTKKIGGKRRKRKTRKTRK